MKFIIRNPPATAQNRSEIRARQNLAAKNRTGGQISPLILGPGFSKKSVPWWFFEARAGFVR